MNGGEERAPMSDTAAQPRLAPMRLPPFSGHPICTDLLSVGEDVHCEATAQEVHAGLSA